MRRVPWVFRVWRRVLGVLHVRSYRARPGEGAARYILTEPWDAWAYYTGRAKCRVLRTHNYACHGREDHRAAR